MDLLRSVVSSQNSTHVASVGWGTHCTVRVRTITYLLLGFVVLGMSGWNDLTEAEKGENIRSHVGVGFRDASWSEIRREIHSFGRMLWERELREREMVREWEEAYEESKSERVGFYTCPQCGCDTGSWSGGFENGEFVKESPPVFVHGVKEWQGQVSEQVTCLECGHESSESRFVSTWEEKHGERPCPPEPSVPHPEPTAERLYQQRVDAHRAKHGGRF